ncbi:Phospholipase/carboxylesterase/thioesterase [Desarmillaria tabescens]|uniref:Acyl-protein thioesterase 1 n=1 Tax=Armillaria tabescens TaxID=1929756 RepID=A0AA39MZ74_ARMTA|nr:Phospholipase/carboxylesterase/thioesterase [Desarmillaria tabescens]KAK0452072.1 Phospholipase/carboxylesterase/thioesterase [Desarmillaria tabescens]
MVQALQFLTIPAKTTCTATVILMHGLGDSGNGMMPIAQYVGSDPALSHVKWILPHAPTRPVTISGGRAVPAWYDITAFQANAAEDEPGIKQSIEYLSQLMQTEMDSGIDSTSIVFGGLSQGASLSLFMGLTIKEKLGGIVMLSGRMLVEESLKKMFYLYPFYFCSDADREQNITPHATSIPIFIAHGSEDRIITLDRSQSSVAALKQLRYTVHTETSESDGITHNIYQGLGHSVADAKVLDDLSDWLKKTIPAN